MKFKKWIAVLTAVLTLAAVSAFALAEDTYGSSAVTEGQTYTLEQMLTYAIQDEYAARAEYAGILSAYGDNNAFANTVKAEETHIADLTALFNAYGFAVPADDAASRVSLPASLQEAYETGIAAENANIAMYAGFLAQGTLPQAVRDTFTNLQNASRNHLSAMTQNAEKSGLGNGNGNARNDGAQGQGRNSRYADNDCTMMGQRNNSRYNTNNRNTTCDGTGDCDGTCTETPSGNQNRWSNDN